MRSSRDDVSRERVLEVLSYDPETGNFHWRVRCSPRAPIGSVAGVIHPWGYRIIGIDGRDYKAHRLAWLVVKGIWPIEDIDHVNRIRSDNRIVNLREATRSENLCNKAVAHSSGTGVKGVQFNKKAKKFQARIQKNGLSKYLGLFNTLEDARVAYARAAIELHGEFSNIRNHGGNERASKKSKS